MRVLHRRRNRLETERRRLKEAYVRGDFEEDADIYRRELACRTRCREGNGEDRLRLPDCRSQRHDL